MTSAHSDASSISSRRRVFTSGVGVKEGADVLPAIGWLRCDVIFPRLPYLGNSKWRIEAKETLTGYFLLLCLSFVVDGSLSCKFARVMCFSSAFRHHKNTSYLTNRVCTFSGFLLARARGRLFFFFFPSSFSQT